MAHSRHSRPLFEEVQPMPRVWLLLLGAAWVMVFAIFAHGLDQQLVLHRPFGNHPLSDSSLMAVAAVVFATMAFCTALLALARLTVRVYPRLVDIEFFPVRRRHIPAREITSAEPGSFNSFEYGGWGIRLSLKGNGWVYNVRGHEGVQLVMRNGKRLLIGSERPRELARAIQQAMQ